MQVVSGALGKEKVHFQAPDAKVLKQEFALFSKWFNRKDVSDDVIKAALAHLWFVTLHPFEDGNGRMARAVTDMLLAKSDGLTQRFYSMSAQIRVERKGYYDILENTQKGGLDVTPWLQWFLNCLYNALQESEHVLGNVLFKHRFWNKYSAQIFNDRQIRIVNKLMDGFTGNLTSSKWAKINGCSADTALRDINDLVHKGVLEKDAAGGRSTNYSLVKEL